MKKIIQFRISRGERLYIAEGVDLPVVTQGNTLDEVMENLKEAIEVHLEGENLADLGLIQEPSVLISFELPNLVYAKT